MKLYSQELRWRKNSSSQQGVLNGRQGREIRRKRGEKDAEDTTGTQWGGGSKPRLFSHRRGPRPARIGGMGKRRDLRRSLVWEDEGLHFKKQKKKQAQGIWGLLVKKNRMNADFLVTSIMMNPELREIDLAMICI